MDVFVIQTLNTLFYSSVLFLIAGGLSLLYGVMKIVNLAHGSLYALGAYVAAWAVGQAAGGLPVYGLIALLPLGAVAVAALGAAIEPALIRPLYNRAEEYQLLITFGLLLILEDVMRLLWGGTPLSAGTLSAAFGSFSVLGLLYPRYNVIVIAVGAVSALALWAFVYNTRFGVFLRATSQDRRMAAAIGVDTRRVYILAFALGCMMAGLGGSIVVPTQAAVLGMGIDALILAFVVVVIGGLGSLKGALIGALIASAVRTAGIQFYPEIELAVLYLIAAIVLLVRPFGLFGRQP